MLSLRHFKKAAALVANPRFRAAMRHGVGATIEHRHLQGLDVATVIDVGANKGQFSLLCLEIYPQATVYAFEPLAAPRSRFAEVLDGEPRVVLFDVALGSEEGERAMHVSARDDSSSLLPITDRQTRFAPGTQEAGTTAVAVRRLDSVLPADALTPPVLLKIDVQGYELPVLNGAAGLLAQVEHVYVELSFVELYRGQALVSDALRLLLASGFDVCGVYNPAYGPDGRAVQADFLLRRLA